MNEKMKETKKLRKTFNPSEEKKTRHARRYFFAALILLAAFGLWTAAICLVDVRAIGPQGSRVGFAAMNQAIHSFFGVHMPLYTLTDYLGLIPVFMMLGFAVLGLCQWIARGSIFKTDRDILLLGGFYILLTAAYLLFEKFSPNFRPVLINGYLEASYPSSTTLLVLCVCLSAMVQVKKSIRGKTAQNILLLSLGIFSAFMVIGRLLSGAHWFSDIVGGILLSMGLVSLYAAGTEI